MGYFDVVVNEPGRETPPSNSTIRVLYIIDSLISGGAETSLAHMAQGYRDQATDLHIAFLKSRWVWPTS